MSLSSTEGRRPALLQAKLGALVRDGWGDVGGRPGPFPSGATLLSEDGTTAWVLVEPSDDRALGPALAWTRKQGAASLNLLVATSAVATVARRAAAFRTPVTVWEVKGRQLIEGTAAPLSPPPPLPAAAGALAGVLRASGAEPVVEFGVLTGEVLGLEVARVLVGEDGEARLEVGVGSHDREARQLMRPDQPVEESLADTVELIRRLRRPDAPRHLANTLAGERWLRAVLVEHPELVGAAHLAPVPPPVPGRGLRQSRPVAADGVDRQDRPVVVVASTGIDLDLVPWAADARLAVSLGLDNGGLDSGGLDPLPRLVIAVPEGDDHPATRGLAADLRDPAEVVAVRSDWRTLSANQQQTR